MSNIRTTTEDSAETRRSPMRQGFVDYNNDLARQLNAGGVSGLRRIILTGVNKVLCSALKATSSKRVS